MPGIRRRLSSSVSSIHSSITTNIHCSYNSSSSLGAAGDDDDEAMAPSTTILARSPYTIAVVALVLVRPVQWAGWAGCTVAGSPRGGSVTAIDTVWHRWEEELETVTTGRAMTVGAGKGEGGGLRRRSDRGRISRPTLRPRNARRRAAWAVKIARPCTWRNRAAAMWAGCAPDLPPTNRPRLLLRLP